MRRLGGVRARRAAALIVGIAALASIALIAKPGLVAAMTSIDLTRNNGPELDLKNYVLTFNDEFKDLSISARGDGKSRWIAHTPWGGDFGDAVFADPGPDSPFSLTPAGLRITASKGADGRWRSGLISSRDKDGAGGRGFAQRYGYFEMSAKLPAGKGVWPAFWLIGVDKQTEASEIDVIEYYGHAPGYYHSVAHLWSLQGKDTLSLNQMFQVEPHTLEQRFNTYGVLIDPVRTSFYLNRHRTWSIPTPDSYRKPMYLLANLALGSGWPVVLDGPVWMDVAYIRAYRPITAGGRGAGGASLEQIVPDRSTIEQKC